MNGNAITIKDSEGREWKPRLTARAIHTTAQAYEIRLDQIFTLDIPAGAFFELFYQSCKIEATKSQLGREEFMDRFDLAASSVALRAICAELAPMVPAAPGAVTEVK